MMSKLYKSTVDCFEHVHSKLYEFLDEKRGGGGQIFPPKRQYVGCAEAEYLEPYKSNVFSHLLRYLQVSVSSKEGDVMF
jgi:hypothetical protein